MRALSWHECEIATDALLARWNGHGAVWGVPRGGVPVAVLLRARGIELADVPGPGVLVVDDLVDSGRTLTRYAMGGNAVDALFRKPHSPDYLAPNAFELGAEWVRFPWEPVDEAGPADAVVRLLEHVGEDPGREGLIDTPNRVLRALAEMTSGYGLDPADVLATTFDGEACDEMVVLRNIAFTSLCEHHMLPFVGTATVAYVPGERLVGLSKLARIVEVFACRLQLQERLTVQIADALDRYLEPRGVGVLLQARHSCMGCRGVRKAEAEMVTSALRGFMKDDDKARGELLALANVSG